MRTCVPLSNRPSGMLCSGTGRNNWSASKRTGRARIGASLVISRTQYRMYLQELHVIKCCPGGRHRGQELPQTVCFLQCSQSSNMIEFDLTDWKRAPEESSKLLLTYKLGTRGKSPHLQFCLINEAECTAFKLFPILGHCSRLGAVRLDQELVVGPSNRKGIQIWSPMLTINNQSQWRDMCFSLLQWQWQSEIL